MKEVNTKRFQQKEPEKISFQADSLNEKSPALKSQPQKSEQKRIKQRNKKTTKQENNETRNKPNKQTTQQENNKRNNEHSLYYIEIPSERRVIRSSFDILEDQKTALSKIQLAEIDAGNKKKTPLNNMVREALDNYIKTKVAQEENLKIVYEPNKETNKQ